MVTLENITDDIIRFLTNNSVTDESRLHPSHIDFCVAEKRAEGIRQTVQSNGFLDPIWLQDMGIIEVTEVESSDDPNVSGCKCKFGKFTIPQTISLDTDDRMTDWSVFRINSACKRFKYYPETLDRLMELDNKGTRANHRYFFRIGNSVYITPSAKQVNVILLLTDPLDGYVLQTENILSGSLIIGEQYVVIDGAIVHNGVTHSKTVNPEFTAVISVFTGNGLVRFKNQKRRLKRTDPYPISGTLLRFIKREIFKDFGFESQMTPDLRNDSQDEQKRRK